jgi:uncharacterized protein (DUF58 family)
VLVERTIAMAASLASTALEEGLAVGLYVWTAGEWVGIHATRGKRQREDLLSILARLTLNERYGTRELLESSGSFLKSGTTAVLVTPQPVQLGLAERVRGAMVVVSAAAPASESWFHFADNVDFTTCMPVDQQPDPEKDGKEGKADGRGQKAEAHAAA